MKTISKPTNIDKVTSYFLSCGYFYRENHNNIETSIDRQHGVYMVASYHTETLQGISNIGYDKLSDAKKEFKRLVKLSNETL